MQACSSRAFRTGVCVCIALLQCEHFKPLTRNLKTSSRPLSGFKIATPRATNAGAPVVPIDAEIAHFAS